MNKKYSYDPDKALAGLQEIQKCLKLTDNQYFGDAHAYMSNTHPDSDILCEIDVINRKVGKMIQQLMKESPLSMVGFNGLPAGEVFAEGKAINAPDGIYMTASDIGRELLWVAKKGHGNDWAIYIHWSDRGREFVITNGDKLGSESNIKKLVPCTDEVFNRYHF